MSAAADPGPGPLARPRVVVVDDHSLFRAGVTAELAHDIELVGEAGDVDSAVQAIERTQPDVVLLDVHLPGGGGAAVLQRASAAGSRFLAISVSDAPEDVIGLVRAGARGYVTKSITASDLADAVRQVADGDAYFSPKLAGFVLDAFGDATQAEEPADNEASQLDRLTDREREVMRLLARGYAYKEIATKLYISVKTVESHASAVLRKLQLSSRHELARWVSDRDLL